MKYLLKRAAGAVLRHAGMYSRLFGDDALIIAFHRIDDRYVGNPISYAVEGFRRFCVFFSESFDVVALDELIDDLQAGRPVAGKLVITFDDGYRDNYDTAAPILEDLGLPATFFISTGFIGTDRTPWWDQEAGIRSEWMDWAQVSDLFRRGFSIGAHTVNHVDLGVVEGSEAEREIVGSRDRLERELGAPVDLFAFPYGREENLTDENRALIRSLGFRCAPSCWGGRVEAGDDPFRLRRTPISPWYRSVEQFAFESLRE